MDSHTRAGIISKLFREASGSSGVRRGSSDREPVRWDASGKILHPFHAPFSQWSLREYSKAWHAERMTQPETAGKEISPMD
jgi:hypothetical protein